MAINPNTQYPGKTAGVSADYPYGEAQNITVPSDGTGTPWEAALVNDLFGFQQALLDEANIVPSGTPEKATDSQYLEALKVLLKSGRRNLLYGNFRINQRGVSGSVVLAAGEYGHDRFRAGSGGCTYTFATSANVTTVTISAGTLEQEVEGENIYSDDYILSWSGTSQGQIDGGGFGVSGLVTATLTGGTNAIVEFNNGTLSLPQLELGTYATPFEDRPIGEELDLCVRYYRPAYNIAQTYNSGAVSTFRFGYTFSEMVAIPTVTINNIVGTITIVNIGANDVEIANSSTAAGNHTLRAELELDAEL